MNIEMIEAAAARIGNRARVTPLLSSPFIDKLAGRRVWVKAAVASPDEVPGDAGAEGASAIAIEYAGLARGEDPTLKAAVEHIAVTNLDALRR